MTPAAKFVESRIEDLCLKVTSGLTPLRGNPDFYVGGTIDWFKTGELNDWFVESSNEKVTQAALDQTSLKTFPAGTVLMAMYGDGRTITSLGILRSAAASNQACAAMIIDRRKCDQMYFFYALMARRHLLVGLALGGAQRNLSGRIVKDFRLPVPGLVLQRRIAGILSAYDDLIENCQRRIRILEDMARSLYREWFVSFRFPGAEAVPLVDSPLGPIPTNWCAAPLRQLTTKIGSGATPRGGKEAYGVTGLSLIRSLNVYDYRFEFGNLALIDDDQAAQLSNVKVEPGDVLLNITGASVARCSMVPSHVLPARVNQHVAIVRANRKLACAAFLLDTINNDHNKQRLLTLAQGGATREALTKNTISEFLVVVPPFELVSRYGEVAQPIHDQRDALQRKCQNLRRTRDLLLPRLLSGQISLGEATEQAQDQTQATVELADASLVS